VNLEADVSTTEAYRLLPKGKLLTDASGNIRGKQNSVRAGLGAFQPLQTEFASELLERLYSAEKNDTIVLYTTSLEAVRKTRDDCTQMLKLFELLNLRVKIKDVHLEPTFGKELENRLRDSDIDGLTSLPRLFINAVHIGGLDAVIRMNDNGDLKRATIDFEQRGDAKCVDCAGYGYTLCTWCQGSQKSRAHNFHDADEKASALKCTVCNENGLQRCQKC
jgi:glutaredoxin domain-containing cysteine-rich protein 1